MHWMDIFNGNLNSVAFQKDLNDYFVDLGFFEDSGCFLNNTKNRSIEETKDYQDVLIPIIDVYDNYKDISCDDSTDSCSDDLFQSNLLEYVFNSDVFVKNDLLDSNCVKKEHRVDCDIMGVELLENKSIYKPDILISPNNVISLVKPRCPHCGYVGGEYHDVYSRKLPNKDGDKEDFKITLYKCGNCGKTYSPFTYKKIIKKLRDKINLDERIKSLYAKTGLSYDKVAETIGILYDVSLSHTYIKDVIEETIDEFDIIQKIVILSQDHKIKGKTAKDRKSTDIGFINLLIRNDVDFSGKLSVDEVFLKVMKNRQYLVSFMDHEISDMPIALAIVSSRHFEVMNELFNLISKNNQIKGLTTDMLKVYGKIADEKNIPHQECIFHSMLYVGTLIEKELKIKDKYDSHEKIWINGLYTEYKEIIRQLNYGDAVDKMEKFLKKIDELPDFFKSIGKHLRKHFKKMFTHLTNSNVKRTSNTCETFNSLPQIRRVKNSSKNISSLMKRLACTIKYYTPNIRTLQKRGEWHKLPQ